MRDNDEPNAGGDPFAPEHNWCDRRCERCALADRCALAHRERGQRWSMRQRGIDPDSHEAFLLESLMSAERMLERIAAEEGVNMHERVSERPITFTQKRLTRAAMDVAQAVGTDAEGTGIATLIVMKIARVGSYIENDDLASMDVSDEDSIWRFDGGPNLLLIEHLIQTLAAKLAATRQLDALRSLAQLEEMLRPLLARIEPLRPFLSARVAAGSAPSPFRVVPDR